MKTENNLHDKKVCEMNFEIIKDKIINEITESAMCLNKSIENAIVLHASVRFANYLQNKKKWVKFHDIDNFFMLLQQYDLGDIYGLSFSYLCKHFAMYEAHLRTKKTMINEIKHEEVRQLESNDESFIKTTPTEMFKRNPAEFVKEMPTLYGYCIANLKRLENETNEDYNKRALRHFEKKYKNIS